MDLNILWFILIGILFTGYFILEGFDFGVGILMPFLGKKDNERRMVLNTIGPNWDANEVWVITAGGAMFAAFPGWYASLFSGFYLALFLLLVVLIVRGVGIEFRSKQESPRWRNFWDWAISISSLLAALLWGVAFANILQGVPIDANQNYVGTFWNLFSPFSLVLGLLTLVGFTYHGAQFLRIKTTGQVLEKAAKVTNTLWIATMVLALAAAAILFLSSNMLDGKGALPVVLIVLGLVALIASGLTKGHAGNSLPFWLNTVAIALLSAAFFAVLFPNVLVSSIDPNFNLTIYNAASSTKTLRIMSIVAAIGVPIVLLYQGWSYWIFRRRLTDHPSDLHY